MDIVLSYLQQYWGLILFVICFIVFLVAQGRTKATKIILSLMLRAEKEAEALFLKNGDEKFMFVVNYGYNLLPKTARLIITYSMFENMANTLYATAKNYLSRLNTTDDNIKPKREEIQEEKVTDPG